MNKFQMKKWFRLFLCFFLITPHVPIELKSASKQTQKKSKNKQSPVQRKKEADRKKQMSERAAAARKKKAEEKIKEEREKKEEENERITIKVAEIRKDIRFASYRLDDVEIELKKISTSRNVILQSINRSLSKPIPPTLLEAKGKLLRLKKQAEAKIEETKEAYKILGRLKIVCAKYLNSKNMPHDSAKLLLAYEKALVGVKRDFSSIESTIKRLKNYNSNYARFVTETITEFVQSGIQFSEQEKELIKKLRSIL